jgi:hypothetical protein
MEKSEDAYSGEYSVDPWRRQNVAADRSPRFVRRSPPDHASADERLWRAGITCHRFKRRRETFWSGKGIELVYGGARVGLMGAVPATVLIAGGTATGVMPRALVEREIAYQGLTTLPIVDTIRLVQRYAEGVGAEELGIARGKLGQRRRICVLARCSSAHGRHFDQFSH